MGDKCESDSIQVTDCLGEWDLTVGPDFGCVHHEAKVEVMLSPYALGMKKPQDNHSVTVFQRTPDGKSVPVKPKRKR